MKSPDVDHTPNLLSKYKVLLVLTVILLICFLLYSKAISFNFLNLDDDYLVYANKYVTRFPEIGFKLFFSMDLLFRDPLTTISQAFVYRVAGMNPMAFHLVNIIFHLLNISFVFFIVKLLFKRTSVAAVVALLFGTHPFHVESVVWIAERKDVLYTFFYLGGLISYIKYIKNSFKYRYLIFTFLCGLLSLLSKSAAVTFPVVLLLVDYYFKRPFTKRVILEKIPFFVIVLSMSIAQIHPYVLTHFRPEVLDAAAVKVSGEVDYFNYTFFDRFFIIGYCVFYYLTNSVVPYSFSAMHSYPFRINGHLPLSYYITTGIIVLTLIFLTVLLYRKRKNISRDFLFGPLFFVATILLVIQIIPIKGLVVVAERYSYLPYLGIAILIGAFCNKILESDSVFFRKLKFKIFALLFGVIIINIFISSTRMSIWENSITLFTDVISKNKYNAVSFINRGDAYADIFEFQKSLDDLTTAINMVPNNPTPWYNRGLTKYKMGDYKGSIEDYNVAIKLKNRNTKALSNRGISEAVLKEYDKALEDFNAVLLYDTLDFVSIYNRGRTHFEMGNKDLAIKDFNKVLKYNPNDFQSYFFRGIATSDPRLAIKDLDKAVYLRPDLSEAYYNRGMVRKDLKDYYGALSDMTRAIDLNLANVAKRAQMENDIDRIPYNEGALNFKLNENKAFAFYNKGRLNYFLGKNKEAIDDLTISLKLNGMDWDAYLFRGMSKSKVKDFNGAIQDFDMVLKLKPDKVDALFEKGNANFLSGNIDEALTNYNKAIDIKPDASLYSNRGNVKFSKKDFKGAIIDFNKAIDLTDSIPDYFFNRGVAKFNLKNNNEACKDFNKASEMGLTKAGDALKKYCK